MQPYYQRFKILLYFSLEAIRIRIGSKGEGTCLSLKALKHNHYNLAVYLKEIGTARVLLK